MGAWDILTDSYHIMRKELLDLTRNKMSLVMSLLMPLLLMIMFGFIYPNAMAQPQGLPVAIVDLSHSGESAGFIGQLRALSEASVKMDFHEVDSIEAAREMITRNDLYGAIIIPADFAINVSQGRTAGVTVLYDNSNPQTGAQVLAEASALIGNAGEARSVVTISELSAQANENADPQGVLTPYDARPLGTVPGSNYFDFLAPGLLMMIVMMGAMTGVPEGIALEKDQGTFDGMLSAPVSPVSVILGKSVALTIGAFLQGLIAFVLAVVVFGVHIQGSILLVFGLLLLGVFSFIGSGILFTSVTEDLKSGALIANLLMFCMMFISGVMFPIQQMPWFLQWVSKVIPITYAADAMRKVMVLNAGLTDVLPQIAILVAFGAVTMLIAIPVFKWSVTR